MLSGMEGIAERDTELLALALEHSGAGRDEGGVPCDIGET